MREIARSQSHVQDGGHVCNLSVHFPAYFCEAIWSKSVFLSAELIIIIVKYEAIPKKLLGGLGSF